MSHQHAREHRTHRLLVRIEPTDGLFEASIEEPGAGGPHWVMSGPPRTYDEVVGEILAALEHHVRKPGE
jgi:hypothetical protein